MEEIETGRLRARRIRQDDFDDLCRMHRNPLVMATLLGVRSDEKTRRMLAESLEHWEKHGFGLWIVHNKADGRFAGRGGLRHVHVGGRNEVEVAYAFMPEFWGRGLATEFARATAVFGLSNLSLPNLVCFTLTTNLASRRVMEKTGFVYERDIMHARRPHVLYRAKQVPPGRQQPFTARM